MTRRRMSRAAARAGVAGMVLLLGAAGLASPAQAFRETPVEPLAPELIDPSEIPSVHDTLYKVPDGVVRWDILADLEITQEVLAPLRVIYSESYSEAIEALDGEQVKLMGFLFPLEGGTEHARFLLTAWPPSCPFCLPAGPTQMVEVMAADAIEFSEGAILLEGRFELLHDDPSGLYYRLHDARLLERFDDIRWTG